MGERKPGFYWVSVFSDPPVVAEWSVGWNGGAAWWLAGDHVPKRGVKVLSARLVPPEVPS